MGMVVMMILTDGRLIGMHMSTDEMNISLIIVIYIMHKSTVRLSSSGYAYHRHNLRIELHDVE